VRRFLLPCATLSIFHLVHLDTPSPPKTHQFQLVLIDRRTFPDIASFSLIRNRKAAALSKRASNVLKLTQEKQNLEQELREMAERLEAIEKRAQELKARGDGGTPPDQASPLPTPPVDS